MKKDAGLPKNAVLGRQYTKGQRYEPGDRTSTRMLEGVGSLDMRSLEEQAKDPLPEIKQTDMIFNKLPKPFTKKKVKNQK
jgi:hypothetical protein